ncbi:MAG: LysM peptidoglycan-binding domain-containing protein [Oligoflexia bacterium]|nr:LysM peptidoglycan-binding domain-containing protein [Oligoflexia bacterium]
MKSLAVSLFLGFALIAAGDSCVRAEEQVALNGEAYAFEGNEASQPPTRKFSSNPARRADFLVPKMLEARVGFWIDVFTVYGKDQVVLHHRSFPQAVFSVLDFRREASQLNPVQLERYKDRAVKQETARVESALSRLAAGQPSNDPFDAQVERAMRAVPGGSAKYSEAVKEDLVRSQTGIREKYAEAIKRSGRYMYILEKIFVNDFNLPVELTRLPFIESSFDYTAYSSVGAAGIWQFMRGTGRKYMTVSSLVDERRDVVASTRAAAQYLRAAHDTLGNWPLAVTSYNHGVGGVLKKVRQFGSPNLAVIVEHPSQRVFGFASSNFYPEFLAALEVYDNRQKYFPEVQLENPLRVSELRLPHPVTVGHVLQQFSGLSTDELKSANYALADSIWSGRSRIPAGYHLKIPERFAPQLALVTQRELLEPEIPAASSVYGGITYKVRPGDTLSSIARKYQTSVADLQALNGLSAGSVRVGQLLRVRSTGVESAKAPSRPVTQASAQPVARTYKVKAGDSLWSISRNLGISVDQLKRANRLSRGTIKPGNVLKIP